MASRIPPDKINLRLILVSGKTRDFLFDPHDSASDIAQHVFDHWPRGKGSHFISHPVKNSGLKLQTQGKII